MSLLSLSDVSFGYSSGPVLFEGLSFSIDPNERTAIVGPNGAGKSTLLQLLAGQLTPVRGTVARRRGLTIAIAEQDALPDARRTLFDYAFSIVPAMARLRERIGELESRLSELSCANRYAELVNQYEEGGGYAAEADLVRILSGLGFRSADFDRGITTLSGGERTRAALARALASRADLLILDEPSNHLDSGARQWLEQNLVSRTGACVIASHDRALLSAFAERIIEIDRSGVRLFEGDYDQYRRARATLDAQSWAAYERFQRRRTALARAAERRQRLASRVAATPDGVRGGKDHYARKAAKVARTARILRERGSEENRVEKPWEEQPIQNLSFEQMVRSGDLVLVASRLAKSYGSRTLFQDLSFHVRRGERLAITGANGSGKTTLLNIIGGSVAPDQGSVRYGAKVEIGVMTQALADVDSGMSPVEICGMDTAARTLLACLKVRPECLNRPMRELSGGERTKVALARILNSKANLLLLDEPTNHLEIEAQEALEEALLMYPVTVVLVSHDRFFLEALGSIASLDLGRTVPSDESFAET